MTTTSKMKLHSTDHWRKMRKRILLQFSPATSLQKTAADCIVDASLHLETELSLRRKSREQEADDPTSGVPTVSSYSLWDPASIRNAIKYLAVLIGECDEFPYLHENRKEEISKLFGQEFVADLIEWTPPSWDAYLLADHLTKHAKTFRRPLPPETAAKVPPDPKQMKDPPDPKQMKEMMLKLLHQKMCHLREHLQFSNSKQNGLHPVSSKRESGSFASALQDLQRSVAWLRWLKRHNL
jgi:hypothetical protein